MELEKRLRETLSSSKARKALGLSIFLFVAGIGTMGAYNLHKSEREVHTLYQQYGGTQSYLSTQRKAEFIHSQPNYQTNSAVESFVNSKKRRFHTD